MRVPRLACIQVKATAPAWAACLESRFQPACIAAAAAISAIAVRLTGSPVGRARRAPGVVRSLGWRAPGIPNGPSRLLSREVLAACRPFPAPLGPGRLALIVSFLRQARRGTLGATACLTQPNRVLQPGPHLYLPRIGGLACGAATSRAAGWDAQRR